MKVKLDEGAYVPVRAHTYDAGMDLCSREDAMILPFGGHKVFDTGVHVQVPESFMGEVRPRSGLMFNHRVVAGIGTVDPDYRGSVRVILFNFGDKAYEVKKGDRIAQLVVTPCALLQAEVTEELDKTERGCGGFGSTGR